MNYGMDYQGGGYGGGGGGGFDTGGGGLTPPGASPPTSAGGRPRKGYDEQSIQPLTIRMCLDSSPSNDEQIMLPDGRQLHHVQIVGAIRSFENYSTNCVFELEDGTGLIEVKQWIDANDCSGISELRQLCQTDNIYLKIVGQIKEYGGKKQIVADNCRPLSTGNELTHHMLDVVYTAEKFQQPGGFAGSAGGAGAQPFPAGQQGMGFGGVPLQQSYGGGGGGGASANNNLKESILHFFQTDGAALSENGAAVSSCVARLAGSGHNEYDIKTAINEIAAEGHIYSTLDDEHYKFAM